ncbi:hypothetical protein BFJ72_g7203 [Fusarium proliferatum]|uniref:Uncharacterized protein n=1 Tax=Gibberella intermedia TaxID=948311 RepID=A0A420TA29_GIBIN|nr:hypothetical protein BFJ72_g7203 [Fusarium proliferatum]
MSDLKPKLRHLQNHSITIRAFLEKVFQMEIYWATQIDDPANHHKDYLPEWSLDIIKMLLESGLDPNYCVAGHNVRFSSPIGRALNIGHINLTKLLLSFNVRIDHTQACFDVHHAIQAILRGRLSNAVQSRLLKLLKEYKAVSLEEVLCGALKLDDMELIEGILQEDIDVTKIHIEIGHGLRDGLMDKDSCLCYESPLTASLGGNFYWTDKLLNHHSVQNNPSQVLTRQDFIAAAIRGDCQIIGQLQEFSPSGLTCKWNGITCLRAAVAYNNVPVAQMLLERNDCTSPDLLLIAAHYGYEDMVRLLLQHGLSPDEMVSQGDVQWLEYFTSSPPMPKDCGSILQTLLEFHFKCWNASKANCLVLLIEGGALFLGGEIAGLAEIGFQEPLQAALARGASPNDRDEYGRTAIQCALYPYRYLRISRSRHSNTSCEVNKRYRIIKLLLEAGAEQAGEIVNAIRESDYNVTKLLLEHGGTLKDINERGASCLEALIMNSNNIRFMGADSHYFHDHYPFRNRGTMRDDENVRFGVQDDPTIACPTCAASLFDSDSDERDFLQALLEAQDSPIDAGPICAAIQVEDWKLLDLLLAQPHKETNCHLLEGTAIGLAARAGQMEVLEKLLSRFHHPSAIQSGFIPFHIKDGQLVLRSSDDQFLTFNDRPWIYDTNDFWRKDPVFGLRGVASPLALAALGADTSGFGELLAHGCCADKTTFTVIVQKESASAYLDLLRKHSQQLDTLFPSQPTLCSILLGPIANGNIELLKRLVGAGSDVNDYNATIDSSRSPLQLSAQLGDLGAVHYLIKTQADVNSAPSFSGGGTALQFAAIGGYMGIANLLIDHGARINARGSRKSGRTALEGAAEHGRLDMLELLLQRGAAWSNYGRQQFISAVRVASENAHYAAVDWLKNRYGWTEEDEDFLKNGRDNWLHWDDHCKNCRDFCCDEIHGIEDDCRHYYPDDKEEEWAAACYYCKFEVIEDDESQSEGDEALYQRPEQELENDVVFFEPWQQPGPTVYPSSKYRALQTTIMNFPAGDKMRWNSLYAEARLKILDFVANSTIHEKGSIGRYARVSREWQDWFEIFTFKRVEVSPSNIMLFANTFLKIRRRKYLQYIGVRLDLPVHKHIRDPSFHRNEFVNINQQMKALAQKAPTLHREYPWLRHQEEESNRSFTIILRGLFMELFQWKREDCHHEGIELELIADSKSHWQKTAEEYLALDPPTDIGNETFYDSLSSELQVFHAPPYHGRNVLHDAELDFHFWLKLDVPIGGKLGPEVQVISSLSILRRSVRHFDPESIAHIVSLLPRLRILRWEVRPHAHWETEHKFHRHLRLLLSALSPAMDKVRIQQQPISKPPDSPGPSEQLPGLGPRLILSCPFLTNIYLDISVDVAKFFSMRKYLQSV